MLLVVMVGEKKEVLIILHDGSMYLYNSHNAHRPCLVVLGTLRVRVYRAAIMALTCRGCH